MYYKNGIAKFLSPQDVKLIMRNDKRDTKM